MTAHRTHKIADRTTNGSIGVRTIRAQGNEVLSRTADLLFRIGESAEALAESMSRPSTAMRMGVLISKDYRDEMKKSRKNRNLDRLEKAKMITINRTGSAVTAALTKKGYEEYLRLSVAAAPVFSGEEECMVIFDIPERRRTIRNELRRFLLRSGFIQLQRSVFVAPYDASEALAKLFAAKGVRRWIRVYQGKEIGPIR